MSNHCRQIWPQVVYTSSKTANNTHSFSLPSLCRPCSCKEAQSDNKAHQKNLHICFSVMLQHFQINVSPVLSNCLFLIKEFYVLLYLSLATRGCPLTSGWQQAWVKSRIVSCYTNVTWRHIIYSSNCWHPNHALNGDTLKLFLCAWADTHAKRRRLTKGGELHVLLTGHEQRRAHTSRRLLLLRPKASEPVWNTSPAADTPPTPDVKCEQISLQCSRKVPTANTSLVTNGGELIAWDACILTWVSVWVRVWVIFIVLFYVLSVGADNKWMR